MRNILELAETQPGRVATQKRPHRSLTDFLARFESIASHSPNLVAIRGAKFDSSGQSYELPRYLFIGPQGGSEPIRVGVFATIHGDESDGAYALAEFIRILEAKPYLASGYCLSIYPICNPTGFEDNTRHSRTGKDLNRKFWTHSRQPEVRLLEAEFIANTFQGIISLHTDKDSDVFYGLARGAVLARELLKPALAAAESFLPQGERRSIAGFQADDGYAKDWFKGRLSASPRTRPRPFEIALATPKYPPVYLKQLALVTALQSVLTEYRQFISHAANL